MKRNYEEMELDIIEFSKDEDIVVSSVCGFEAECSIFGSNGDDF